VSLNAAREILTTDMTVREHHLASRKKKKQKREEKKKKKKNVKRPRITGTTATVKKGEIPGASAHRGKSHSVITGKKAQEVFVRRFAAGGVTETKKMTRGRTPSTKDA